MTAREMHIEVNQSLQKVAANRTRKYEPEEIDWVLNKMVDRFVQSKLRPQRNGSFTFDQLDTDALRTLLTFAALPAYIGLIPQRYECYLPLDYAYLIADSSAVTDNCTSTDEPEVISSNLYLTWLKNAYTNKADVPFYQTGLITLDINNELHIPANLSPYNTYTGFQVKEDISFLTPALLQYFNAPDNLYQIGLNSYGKWTRTGYFVIASTDHQIPASLQYDGIDVSVVSNQVIPVTQHVSGTNEAYTSNRLTASDTVPQFLDMPYYKPSARSPISELVGRVLYIYRGSSFTVNSSRITYIRKPGTISLLLGSDCDLPPEFHNTICDLAVEYIKGRLENAQGQQLVERDNERRVIL